MVVVDTMRRAGKALDEREVPNAESTAEIEDPQAVPGRQHGGCNGWQQDTPLLVQLGNRPSRLQGCETFSRSGA
jgi:hypothetical protein